MPANAFQESSVDAFVESYLRGSVSLEDAVAKLHETQHTWGDLILRVILPADLFRRRMERMEWRASHALTTGSTSSR